MSAIRPDIFAATRARAPTAPLPDAARQAQAAFFRAAMGGAAPAQTTPAQKVPAQTEPVRGAFAQAVAQAVAAPEARSGATPQPVSGRPGGLLDIRV